MTFKNSLLLFIFIFSCNTFFAQERNVFDELDFIPDSELPDINVSAIIHADKDKLKGQLEKMGR